MKTTAEYVKRPAMAASPRVRYNNNVAKLSSAKTQEKNKESRESLQHDDSDLFDRYMNWLVKLPKEKVDPAPKHKAQR